MFKNHRSIDKKHRLTDRYETRVEYKTRLADRQATPAAVWCICLHLVLTLHFVVSGKTGQSDNIHSGCKWIALDVLTFRPSCYTFPKTYAHMSPPVQVQTYTMQTSSSLPSLPQRQTNELLPPEMCS